jgi:metal-sulfur cluster biosynthetic enzyme
LGLIYKIDVLNDKKVNIEMTLTSPNCPVAESLPKMVKDNILNLDEVSDVNLKLVWNPPWTQDMMSEAAKLELNL